MVALDYFSLTKYNDHEICFADITNFNYRLCI